VILSQRRMATAMSCRIKRASRAGLVGLTRARGSDQGSWV